MGQQSERSSGGLSGVTSGRLKAIIDALVLLEFRRIGGVAKSSKLRIWSRICEHRARLNAPVLTWLRATQETAWT